MGGVDVDFAVEYSSEVKFLIFVKNILHYFKLILEIYQNYLKTFENFGKFLLESPKMLDMS